MHWVIAHVDDGAQVKRLREALIGPANQQEMRKWDGKHLGLADKGGGVMMPRREKDNPETEHVKVWSVFTGNKKYFEPSQAAFP